VPSLRTPDRPCVAAARPARVVDRSRGGKRLGLNGQLALPPPGTSSRWAQGLAKPSVTSFTTLCLQPPTRGPMIREYEAFPSGVSWSGPSSQRPGVSPTDLPTPACARCNAHRHSTDGRCSFVGVGLPGLMSGPVPVRRGHAPVRSRSRRARGAGRRGRALSHRGCLAKVYPRDGPAVRAPNRIAGERKTAERGEAVRGRAEPGTSPTGPSQLRPATAPRPCKPAHRQW